MENYIEIKDIKGYVENLVKTTSPKRYVKFATIIAVQGKVGEKVVTMMNNGLTETENIVSVDERTNKPDWIITNHSGERYIVNDTFFNKKYEPLDLENNVYKPKGGVCLFVQIKEDISFVAPWGEIMNIAKGGYLNITNLNDIYGVQEKEFNETYAECDKNGKFKNDELNYHLAEEKTF